MTTYRVETGLASWHEAIGSTLKDMVDHHHIESVLSTGDNFFGVPTIAYTLSSEEIIDFAREHEGSGTPYALTGLPLEDVNDVQSPLLQSSEWLENIYRLRSMLFIPMCAAASHRHFSNTAHGRLDAHSDEANAPTDRRFKSRLMATNDQLL